MIYIVSTIRLLDSSSSSSIATVRLIEWFDEESLIYIETSCNSLCDTIVEVLIKPGTHSIKDVEINRIQTPQGLSVLRYGLFNFIFVF